MFEVLGCGKPFVGTKVGGVPEIITSDGYGLLYDSANPKELAEKILIALDKKWGDEKIRGCRAVYVGEYCRRDYKDL